MADNLYTAVDKAEKGIEAIEDAENAIFPVILRQLEELKREQRETNAKLDRVLVAVMAILGSITPPDNPAVSLKLTFGPTQPQPPKEK